MNRRLSVKIIAVVVFLMGVASMFGWWLDIPFLKSIFAFGVTMKFAAALSFALSGIILFNLGKPHLKALKISLAVIIIVIMGVFLTGNLLGKSIGIEKLFFFRF